MKAKKDLEDDQDDEDEDEDEDDLEEGLASLGADEVADF